MSNSELRMSNEKSRKSKVESRKSKVAGRMPQVQMSEGLKPIQAGQQSLLLVSWNCDQRLWTFDFGLWTLDFRPRRRIRHSKFAIRHLEAPARLARFFLKGSSY